MSETSVTAFSELTLAGVSKSFGSRHRHVAVDSVDLRIVPGGKIAVVGESGSGKSTLARMIVGLEQPSSGTVRLDGVDIATMLHSTAGRRALYRTVQFIGQNTTSSFDPRRTLRWSLTDPLGRLLGLSKAECDERVDTTVAGLGLDPALADRYPLQVSGGQRQRFCVGRALVVRPSLLVCDEVVSALDVSVQGAVLNLIKKYCRDTGASLVFVSHGLPAAGFISDEMAVMYAGAIVERGNSVAVLTSPQHEYTRSLLDAYRRTPAMPPPRGTAVQT